jgi:hypothetical protein
MTNNRNCRSLGAAGVLAVLAAWTWPAAVPVAGQAPTAAPAPFRPPPATHKLARTPWGDPDLQGVWDYQSMIRMERPPQLAGKAVFTDAELAEWAKENFPNQDQCGYGTKKDWDCSNQQLDNVGGYNDFWNNRNVIKDNRTSLIIDPPDGRFPPMTDEAQKRRNGLIGARGAGRSLYESFEDFPSVHRCIAEQTPNGVQMYNSGTLITQTPGWIVMFRERLDTRIIPLDGRPHLDGNIRQWNGDSRGRFEGDTLVIETRNFTDKQFRAGVGSTVPAGVPFGNIHVVERWVPVSPTRIHYYATIEDKTTWTRPWTFMLPWERDDTYQIFEYACNEANIALGNALRGERYLEAEAASNPRAAGVRSASDELMGASEETVKATLGEPMAILGPRWTYESTTGNPVYVFFSAEGDVTSVRPNNISVAEVRKR